METFPPRLAKFVRFTIEKTSAAEACIDEFEIYSRERNVALDSNGAQATSSGDFVHPKHKLLHINDGQHGNDRSWIVNSKDGGWVQIEFPEPVVIDRITWGRDRTGEYNDRVAVGYRIEAAAERGQWELLATSSDRQAGVGSASVTYQFRGFPQSEAAQGREWIDELEGLRKKKAYLERSSVVYAGTFAQPGPTHRLYRGEPDAKREQVAPDAIDAFASLNLPVDAPVG